MDVDSLPDSNRLLLRKRAEVPLMEPTAKDIRETVKLIASSDAVATRLEAAKMAVTQLTDNFYNTAMEIENVVPEAITASLVLGILEPDHLGIQPAARELSQQFCDANFMPIVNLTRKRILWPTDIKTKNCQIHFSHPRFIEMFRNFQRLTIPKV